MQNLFVLNWFIPRPRSQSEKAQLYNKPSFSRILPPCSCNIVSLYTPLLPNIFSCVRKVCTCVNIHMNSQYTLEYSLRRRAIPGLPGWGLVCPTEFPFRPQRDRRQCRKPREAAVLASRCSPVATPLSPQECLFPCPQNINKSTYKRPSFVTTERASQLTVPRST